MGVEPTFEQEAARTTVLEDGRPTAQAARAPRPRRLPAARCDPSARCAPAGERSARPAAWWSTVAGSVWHTHRAAWPDTEACRRMLSRRVGITVGVRWSKFA